MSPEDVQHVLDRVRARMPVASSTMEAALEYIGERWPDVTAVRKENAKLKAEVTAGIEAVRELKEEIEDLKRERPVQSDDGADTKSGDPECVSCSGWGCKRCLPDCLPF